MTCSKFMDCEDCRQTNCRPTAFLPDPNSLYLFHACHASIETFFPRSSIYSTQPNAAVFCTISSHRKAGVARTKQLASRGTWILSLPSSPWKPIILATWRLLLSSISSYIGILRYRTLVGPHEPLSSGASPFSRSYLLR